MISFKAKALVKSHGRSFVLIFSDQQLGTADYSLLFEILNIASGHLLPCWLLLFQLQLVAPYLLDLQPLMAQFLVSSLSVLTPSVTPFSLLKVPALC